MPITDEQLTARFTALRLPNPAIDQTASLALVRRAALQTKPRRPGLRLGLTSLIVAGVLAVPTAAVAGKVFEAQTGRFGAAGMTEELAGDEWISTTAPDFATYAESVTPRELPTPQGFSWDEVSQQVIARFTSIPSEVQRIGILSEFESAVIRSWIDEWIAAAAVGDIHRMDTALAVLRDSTAWPGVVATDGGGLRVSMWVFINHMTQGDIDALDWAQGFAEFRYAPSWDGVNRPELFDAAMSPWTELVASHDNWVGEPGSPFWAEYEAIIAELSRGAVI